MTKKLLLVFILVFVLAAIGLTIWVNTGLDLPPETDEIIADVLEADELPELITGQTGIARSGDVDIWYEDVSGLSSPRGTILLIMGHSASALLWTPNFYQVFVDSGYQVIRYDNRSAGQSEWLLAWDEDKPYTLEDMAGDGIAILDALGVEKAHVIGVSMGGMIAQHMAIDYPHRVLSMTSIMSSAWMNDPEAPVARKAIIDITKLAIRYTLFNRSEANQMKYQIGVAQVLKGSGPYNIKTRQIAERTLFELRRRNGYFSGVGDQHSAAIETSGSRYESLGEIKAPVLVVHGVTDPLVLFWHARKYAPLISRADSLFIDGMGHDIPDLYMDQLHEGIFQVMVRGEETTVLK